MSDLSHSMSDLSRFLVSKSPTLCTSRAFCVAALCTPINSISSLGHKEWNAIDVSLFWPWNLFFPNFFWGNTNFQQKYAFFRHFFDFFQNFLRADFEFLYLWPLVEFSNSHLPKWCPHIPSSSLQKGLTFGIGSLKIKNYEESALSRNFRKKMCNFWVSKIWIFFLMTPDFTISVPSP